MCFRIRMLVHVVAVSAPPSPRAAAQSRSRGHQAERATAELSELRFASPTSTRRRVHQRPTFPETLTPVCTPAEPHVVGQVARSMVMSSFDEVAPSIVNVTPCLPTVIASFPLRPLQIEVGKPQVERIPPEGSLPPHRAASTAEQRDSRAQPHPAYVPLVEVTFVRVDGGEILLKRPLNRLSARWCSCVLYHSRTSSPVVDGRPSTFPPVLFPGNSGTPRPARDADIPQGNVRRAMCPSAATVDGSSAGICACAKGPVRGEGRAWPRFCCGSNESDDALSQ